MKERPILFNAEMVRAILEGRKTQTRRLMKPQPLDNYEYVGMHPDDGGIARFIGKTNSNGLWHWSDRCLYGKPGDHLWVRETWNAYHHRYNEDGDELTKWWHEITMNQMSMEEKLVYSWTVKYRADEDIVLRPPKWCPSIHMPRWASRITLEITDIRVERLQEISEEDALSEGIEQIDRTIGGERIYPNYREPPGQWWRGENQIRKPIGCLVSLWDSINKKRGYGWDVNPWVWVVEFKKLESEE